MKKNIKKLSAYILTGMILLESILIHVQTEVYSVENGIAKREEAITWLKENQNSDGSWGTETKLRDTSEVLKYADRDWFAETEIIGAANEWINSQHTSNYDDVYRINSIENSEQNTDGTETTTLQNADITEVTSLQNSDGGWSLSENYVSDIFDTSLALEACINAEEIHTDIIKKGVAYLLSNQMKNGACTYADDTENVYLTAYVSYVLENYVKGVGRNDESAKIALSEAEAYLQEHENERNLWGLDENGMMGTLMTSIVFADNDSEKTNNRIELIAEKLDTDGSMYGNPVLTAMFIKLVDCVVKKDVESLYNTEITELYVYAMKGESIKAYTDVCFEAEITAFDEETMSLSMAVGTKETGYEALESENNVFVWNTTNTAPGKYEVYAIVTENATGEILSIKKKIFNVSESIDVTDTYLTASPKAYKINSNETLSFDASVGIRTNVDKALKLEIRVKDHNGNKIYEDSVDINVTKADTYVGTQAFGFIPETEEKMIYYAELSVMCDGEIVASKGTVVETYSETEEKEVIADYTADRQWVLPESDKVNVKFTLSGVGNTEGVKRMPMDMVICLDNSLSMDKNELAAEVEAAKMIVDYMDEEDKGSIIFVSPGTKASELTDDKGALKNTIDGIRGIYGTYIERAINTATELLSQSEEGRKRVLFILSDGMPDNYNKTINNAKTAVENDITIYTLGIGSVAEKLLVELADIGGGEYMLCQTTEDLMAVMERMAEELFSVAGSDISLSMKPGDGIDIENIVFEKEPDEIVKNDDGTITVTWNKPYMSVGEIENLNINVTTPEYKEGEMAEIFKNIRINYINLAGEKVEVSLPDFSVRVENQYVRGTVITEKDSYVIGEDVAITIEAIKVANDKEVTGVIEITDENGVTVEVLDDTVTLEDELTQEFIWNTGEVVPGIYKAVISWYRNGVIADMQECSFALTEEEKTNDEEQETEDKTDVEQETVDDAKETDSDADIVKIKGEISLSDKNVLIGERIDATYDAVNLGTTLLENTELTVNVINIETQEAEVITEATYDVDIEGTVNGEAGIETINLSEGNYLVTLNAGVGKEQILLGASGFVVTEPQYNLSVTAQTGGTVNIEVCGTYRANSSIELVAVPEEGYVFAGWMSENGGTFENEYSETTMYFTPENDTVVTALFVRKKYLVTVEAENGGRIVQDVSGSYEEGTEIELTVEAFSGYEFKCWMVSGEGVLKDENSITTSFTTGDGDAVVTAMFVERETENATSDMVEDKTELPTELRTESITEIGTKASTESVTESDNAEESTYAGVDEGTNFGSNQTESIKHKTDKTEDATKKNNISKFVDAVKTGDFGDRMIIIRNITFMLLIIVLVSMFAVKKEEE